MEKRAILHVDLNNFYASVACINNPELKEKPIAVSGDPEKRHGIILAKNNLAKACGVKTGEAIWEAKQKCKGLITVPPNYAEYVKYSRMVYDIYAEFTPFVESFGLDECWLDVTGCTRLYGTPEEIAYKIKECVKERTGGLTVSIGVSFSKIFAKLGSDLKKPDAVSIISEENYKDIAWNLPIGDMLLIGKATKNILNKRGVYTIGQLANYPLNILKKDFGKVGEKLWNYANGTDEELVLPYDNQEIPSSVGNGTTTPKDVANPKDATSVICALTEVIGFRLRKYGLKATGVALSLRSVSLICQSHTKKLPKATSAATEICTAAIELLKENYDFEEKEPLRTITVTAINLLSEDSLFPSDNFIDNPDEKELHLEEKVDVLRGKYGYDVLKRGINIGTIFTCDCREVEDEFVPFDKHVASTKK